MKLTKRAIDAATYQGDGNARCVLWDDEIPGFGCRVYPSGRKVFVLSYRAGTRKRLLTVGTFGVLTVDQARRDARAALVQAERGADPLAERERERQGETVADLCRAYMARHGSAKRSGDADQRRIDRHILPRWGRLKARAIKRADVAALHGKLRATPYEANRLLALLSKLFALAERWGFVPEGHPNPARGIDRFHEAKRDRWVTPDELPRLAQAIDAEPNETARFALWLYLLTGCRKSELLNARWDDVDWARAELRIPETKAGRVHYVPLSAPALALLREMPRVEGNPYLLPGRGPHRYFTAGEVNLALLGATAAEKARTPSPLVNIWKPWDRVRKAAGVEDVRLHDLRRTVGSWLAQAGNSLHLIGRVLNHSNQSTTAVYARFGEDSVRAALEQHGARIMGAAGLTPAAEVAELPQKKARG